MSYLANLAKKRADKRQQSAQQHDEYLATLSNDETSADELRSFTKFFVLPLFFLWVAYVGHLYLSKELIGVVPDEHIFWLAWGLPLVFQILKVYGATKCLRAWHFKWYDQSAADLWIYIILGLLTVLAFVWTLKISIWDVNTTARASFIDKNTVSLDAHLNNATADIDARIAEQKQREQETGSVRTKKGSINWAIQPIAAENAKSSSALDEQRAAIVSTATKEFEKNTQKIEEKAQSRGNFFQRFGGFGELGEILCLILIGLLEAKLRRRNAQNEIQQQAEPGSAGHSPNGYTIPNHNGQPTQPRYPTVQNNGRFTFFNRDETGNVAPAATPEQQPEYHEPKTVSHSNDTVTRYDTVFPANYADDVLRLAEKEIRGHVANFKDRQRRESTISDNINGILDDTLEKIKSPGFNPSRLTAIKFYGYVTGLFTYLDEKGWPYSNDVWFAKHLFAKIPEQATP